VGTRRSRHHANGGAFQLLRSNDLIWSRITRDYLMGERALPSDLMAWNADATRLPYRMNSEYLRKLFLNTDLAEGCYLVEGKPIALSDIHAPMFVVGTVSDHVAPWKSVYKIHYQVDADVTFLLTSGGRDAGIVAPPSEQVHSYQINTKKADAPYIGPDEWLKAVPLVEGSWWPEWTKWLTAQSGEPCEPRTWALSTPTARVCPMRPATTFANNLGMASPWIGKNSYRLDEDQQRSRASTYRQGQRRAHMAIQDILLPLVGEPSTAAVAAIDKCTAMARNIGARVTAAASVEILVRPKVMISADLDNTAEAARVRSVSDAEALLKAVEVASARLGVPVEQRLYRLAAADITANLARIARLKDLSIVPVKPHDDQSEKIVERLIFESGRPVMMCPEEFASELAVPFDDVVIAWDHSAPAARAVADALPMLQAAANVRIITATDNKAPAELESGAALVSHLADHGIKAAFETVKIDGSSIGKVFERYVEANRIDLLVMGAYRHSRLNEIVWGGATKTVIGRPPCWVMMSR
jgi:nucleotide-binding universal stress UspA family protein